MSEEYAESRPAGESKSTSGRHRADKKRGLPRQRASRSEPGTVGTVEEGLRGHKRMARRFALQHAGRFIWTPGRGWLEFNGAYWEECGESRPWQAVEEVCRAALAELGTIDSKDRRDELWADVRACDSAAGTMGVLKHAQHWPGIATRDDELDSWPGLFVCRNGTYDMYAQEFRPSDPRDLMTLASNVDYDPDAESPTYDHMMELYQSDPEVRAYLHRLAGAAMEGRQNLQNLIVHYGATGGNGKGTIQRAWMHVFGTYSAILPVEALIARRGYDQYKDEKAQLKAKRLVYLTEPSAGQKFDTGVVKSITGGDPVTSRAVYKASVTFQPTWLIMVSTNNRISTPSDGGMARRLKEIGWRYTIDRAKMRDDLDDILQAEGSGILNRIIDGWIAFQAAGLGEPEAVSQATADYLASVDPVAMFLDECVMAKENVLTPSASLYAAYDRWCRENGEHPLSNKLFSPDMERRGFVKKATKTGNVWQGIAIVAKDEDRWTP